MNSNSSIYRKLWEILIFFYEMYVRMWSLIYPFLLVWNFFFPEEGWSFFLVGLSIFFIYYVSIFLGLNTKAQLLYHAGGSKHIWSGNILTYSVVSIIKTQLLLL